MGIQESVRTLFTPVFFLILSALTLALTQGRLHDGARYSHSRMIRSPADCRPECPSDQTCFRGKCQDPCPGLCGRNASCKVTNHIPDCVCNKGYIQTFAHFGNPFFNCGRPTT